MANNTPDYEGVSFLLEDMSFVRFGKDESYTPNISDFHMLDARLIGFSAKFGYDSRVGLGGFGYMGLIKDSSGCEEAVFTVVSPFNKMTVDISTGTTVSQT